MFTGIVEAIGAVERAGSRLRVAAPGVCEGLKPGDSVSVNGVCLTAVAIHDGRFEADLAPETLRRSNLGDLAEGSLVNLERPMLASGRFDGHIVQGHVDGTGELLELRELGDQNWWLVIRVPAEIERYCVFKGSITIDGISLTIAALEGDRLSVTIIPHTYQQTAIHRWTPGWRVNLEADVIAKYVEKMVRR
jgi:riboflavin synthase